MNRYQEEYQRKLCSAEDIAKRIESNMFFAVSNGVNEPRAITAALCEGLKKDDRKGITYSHSLPLCDNGAFHPELDGKINGVSWFMSGYNRPAYEQGIMDIMPNHLSQMPELYRDYVDVDVFSVAVSPMDEHGYFSYGAICGELRAIERKAKHIFLEVNENMPRTFGDQHIHISKVEAICENHSPLPPYTPAEIDPVSQTIGEFIAAEIPDEATIQLGIGAVPEAVGLLLQEKRDLGIHTELFCDSMMRLIECGAVTNDCKSIHRGISIATVSMGSTKMYEFMNNNPSVQFYPTSYVNDPYVIAQNDKMISVNACLEVDFWGQVASESIGARAYSGTGGQVDFVRGATHSKGGKSFIAMPSTAKGGTISRIRPMLSAGTIITTGKNDVDMVVTEYGIAPLRGRTVKQRVQNLISIAHPQFRDELAFEAKKMHLM